MAVLGISLKNNKEQQELVRLINENYKPMREQARPLRPSQQQLT